MHGSVWNGSAEASIRARHDTAASAEDFWDWVARQGAPLIDPLPNGRVRVTFLWREPAGVAPVARVYLDANSLTDHHAPELARLRRLAGTSVWWWAAEVNPDWRASYCLMPVPADVVARLDPPVAVRDDTGRRQRWLGLLEHAVPDPLNPLRTGRRGFRSMAEMPAAPPQPGWTEPAEGSAEPLELQWDSARLGRRRRVWLHETVGPDPVDPTGRPLVILLDGAQWALDMPAADAFDLAVRTGRLAPCVLLAIDSVDPELRSTELPPNAEFWQAVIDELLPLAHAHAGFSADPARTVVAGQSYGGLAALFAALEFPNRFGLVASQSGSFWWPTPLAEGGAAFGGGIARRLRTAPAPARPLRVVLEVGRQEGAMVPHNEAVAEALGAAGHDVALRVFEGGHDWACWRGGLLVSVVELLGPSAAAGPPV